MDESQEDFTGLTDSKVRAMLVRAGFDVNSGDDVVAFAKFMRFMFADYEHQIRGRDTRRTVFIALGVAATTTLIPILLHLFKVN